MSLLLCPLHRHYGGGGDDVAAATAAFNVFAHKRGLSQTVWADTLARHAGKILWSVGLRYEGAKVFFNLK